MHIVLSASRLYDVTKEKTTSLIDKITHDPLGTIVIPIMEIAFILLLGMIAIRISNRLIDNVFSIRVMHTSRAHTLQKLTKSVVLYSIYFLLLLFVLFKLGFNPLPILAGAGILGLAIGFGAQNLVRDFITGFFLNFERQVEVGDKVEINGQITGIVEEVGLRTTKIREYNQRLHYIPNGIITHVTNYNREKMRAIVNITVVFESDLEKVNKTLEEICNVINQHYQRALLEDASVVGITSIAHHGLQFTITALTTPDNYFSVESDIRKEAVLHLRKNGIQFAQLPTPTHPQ